MDPTIIAKIVVEVNKHSQQEIDAIVEFCKQQQARQHLSMYSLGKAIAKKFNLSETAGIKLANAFNRYMIG